MAGSGPQLALTGAPASAAAAAVPAACGATLAPGRARISPLTMTLSSGAMPLDHAQAVDHRPERDVFRPRHVLGIDDQHELARLLGRRSRPPAPAAPRSGGAAAICTRANMPGVNVPSGLANTGARADRARRAVDGVVDEVEPAVVGEGRLVDELELHRHGQSAVGDVRAVLGEARVAQIRTLVQGELEADRIDRFDGREQGRVPVVPPVTRLPSETRRSPMRPRTGARSSVNSRSSAAWRTAASCAATAAFATRLACVRWSRVCRVITVPTKTLAALQIAFGEGEIGLGLREVRLRLIERGLERPAIDGEQQIALLHHLPVAENGWPRDSRRRARAPRPNSTATKRPTYSSWSAITLLVGFATVTCGGGGAGLRLRLALPAGRKRRDDQDLVSRRTDPQRWHKGRHHERGHQARSSGHSCRPVRSRRRDRAGDGHDDGGGGDGASSASASSRCLVRIPEDATSQASDAGAVDVELADRGPASRTS